MDRLRRLTFRRKPAPRGEQIVTRCALKELIKFRHRMFYLATVLEPALIFLTRAAMSLQYENDRSGHAEKSIF
jgi:hypothetical protein